MAPGGLSQLSRMAGIEEIAEDATAQQMVEHLAGATEKLLHDLRTGRDHAGDEGDSETEDLFISRIQVHEKALWMLRSYLQD